MTKLHESMFAILVIDQVISFLFVSSATVLTTKPHKSDNTSDPVYPLTLEYLGTADQASFFVDNSQHMSRPAAAAFCQSSRLQLPTIRTRAQVDMIATALNEMGQVGKLYWTSARESPNAQLFVWERSGAPDFSIVAQWSAYNDQYYCLFFQTIANSRAQFVIRSCNLNEAVYPLCQT